MAKNWTVVEALEALKDFNKAAIADFGKRFPLATVALVKAGVNVSDFVSGLPEHITMRKIEGNLKADVEEVDFEDADETEDEAPKAKRGRKPKAAKSEEDKKAAAKARRDARKAKAKAAEVDDEDEEEGDSENDYSGMNAVELFKLCKKRGITAQPKRKAAEYIELLKAADNSSDDSEDEGDDWEDDEEEVMPTPKKKAGRPPKAKAEPKPVKGSKAKAAPEPEEEEEEDDDWDI